MRSYSEYNDSKPWQWQQSSCCVCWLFQHRTYTNVAWLSEAQMHCRTYTQQQAIAINTLYNYTASNKFNFSHKLNSIPFYKYECNFNCTNHLKYTFNNPQEENNIDHSYTHFHMYNNRTTSLYWEAHKNTLISIHSASEVTIIWGVINRSLVLSRSSLLS